MTDTGTGPGRPPKGKRVAAWIPPDQLAIIDSLAKAAGVSRSDWIATAATMRLERHDVIELRLPVRDKPELVDLASLTPRARAIAEAVAQTTDRWILIKSVATERELMHERFHDFYQPADEPITRVWDGWWKAPKDVSAADVLEWEARKLVGWYPVSRRDGSELPSSQAAAADDLLDANQCLALLAQLGRGDLADKNTWMHKARHGVDGYPAAVRRIRHGWLWSAADVRVFAEHQPIPE